MIRVCDAIMGSGKTEAAITFMNSHPEKKFIYISPYLDEATRIREGCPDLHFVEPSKKIKDHGFSKSGHALELIKEGRNIASTHCAIGYYTKEMMEEISARGYTLIIDEEVKALEKEDGIRPGDIDVIIDAGYVDEVESGTFSYNGKPYDKDCSFSWVFRKLLSRDLFLLPDSDSYTKKNKFFYWMFSKGLLSAFEDIYILTYLFEGQEFCSYLKLCKMDYELIGVRKTDDGKFDFGQHDEYIPEYTTHIKDMISIVDKGRINQAGDRKGSLSLNWYKKKENVERMQKNLYNFFNNICEGVSPQDKMYGCFKKDKASLRGKGYSKGYVVFNEKATNKYRNRVALAYCVNVYLNVGVKLRFKALGIEMNEDVYALSTMIQWIWRSAIRDGKPITLYVPSKRMRTLLTEWMDSLQKGVSTC